jgi:hypothetical protein
MSVNLHVANRELLFKALKALNLNHYVLANGNIAVNTTEGQIILGETKAVLPDSAQPILNDIKRQYTRQAFSAVAKKYRLTETEKEDGSVVLRRY